MEKFFDYSKGKVDKKNKKRIIFINRLAYLMQDFESTSDEVNELVDWLFYRSEGIAYVKKRNKFHSNYKLQSVKKIDNNTIIKEVWDNDFHLYSYIILLYEHNYWINKDVLSDIIMELYFRLDKIVHPYDGSNRDLENIKYYVELNYCKDEEQ